LHTLAPALDTYIGQVMQDIIGPDLVWTDVLNQLDKLRGKPPRTLNRLDPALQFRMLTERLGDLGFPFDRNNRSRLFSTYGQMLRLSRNQLAHGDDSIEPSHAMNTVLTVIQLATMIEASQTVAALESIREEILEYLWKEQSGNTLQTAPEASSDSTDLQNHTTYQPLALAATENLQLSPASGPLESLSKRVVSWDPIAIQPIGDRDDLATLRRQNSKRKFIQAIETLVEDYGPISQTVLIASVGRAFGVKRLSNKMSQKFIHQLKNAEVFQDQDGFYWSKGMDPTQWSLYRSDATGQRQVRDISPYELANLVEILVEAKPSTFDKDRLINEIGSHFGLQRIIGPTKKHLNLAIKRSLTTGRVHRDTHGKFKLADAPATHQNTKTSTNTKYNPHRIPVRKPVSDQCFTYDASSIPYRLVL